ncbi:MAG TPA: CoA transferase, partial [Thalassobaculum sp.]
NAAIRYFTSGKAPGPLGARHPSITPFEAFETGDGYVIVAAGNDALFRKLADALGRPEWKDDPRYVSNPQRAEHVEALKAELETILRTAPTEHWMQVLDAAGIPAGPINDIGQAVNYPQAAARNMIVDVDDPITGPMKVIGNPIKISGFADPSTRAPAPNLDQDRGKILKEIGR